MAYIIFTEINVLCVSYPNVTEFSATLFLLLARSSSNSPRSFQRFRRTLRRNFKWIRQQIKNFLIDPHCKNWPLSATLPKATNFYNGGLWGEVFTHCWILMKFRLRVRLKRWNDRGEFKLDRVKSKINIAENSVALGHDTHSTYYCKTLVYDDLYWVFWTD